MTRGLREATIYYCVAATRSATPELLDRLWREATRWKVLLSEMRDVYLSDPPSPITVNTNPAANPPAEGTPSTATATGGELAGSDSDQHVANSTAPSPGPPDVSTSEVSSVDGSTDY